MEAGQALAFALDRLQDRGRFFIEPGDQVYKGQVIGEHTRDKDLALNVIKGKNSQICELQVQTVVPN